MRFLILALCVATAVAQVPDCPPVGESLLPHPDCTKYVACANGVRNIMPCPPSLYFSPELLRCDYPRNVPECVGGTRPPAGTTTQTPTTTTTRTTTTEATTTTTTTEAPEPTTTQAPDPNTLTKCGDTITASAGRIEYKFQESYEANELCSFIIRSPEGSLSGHVFTLEAHGFNGTADPNAISIFSFEKKGLVESTHLGPPNPLTQVFIPGGIAVVVFKTQSARGTGFKLSFRAVDARPFYAHPGENLVYGNGTSGNLTIPFWEKPAYKTSVIVLSANHKKIDRSFTALRLTFTAENLQRDMGNSNSCGYDSIKVYDVAYDTIREKGVFCNLLTQKSIYETNGLFILVFFDFEESYWNSHEASFKWQVDSTESIYP